MLVLCTAFAAALFCTVTGIVSGSQRLADFAGYFGAARLLSAGEPASRLYDDAWFSTQLAGMGIEEPTIVLYVNPPTVAIPFLPLAGMKPLTAKLTWQCLTLLCTAWAWWLLVRTLRRSPAAPSSLLLLAGCLASLPLMRTLQLGQLYGLLLLLFAGAFHRFRTGDHAGTALLLACAFALKLYGALFLLLFVVQRRWRMALWSAAAITGVSAVCVFAFDPDAYAALLARIASMSGAYDTASLTLRSVVAPLSRLFVYHPVFNPAAVAHLPLIPTYAPPLLLLLLLTVTFRKPLPDLHAFGAVLVLSVLFTPLAADHHYLLLLIPVTVLLFVPAPAQSTPATVAVLLLLGLWQPALPPPFGSGWTSLLAYSRLYAAAALWWVVVVRGRRIAALELSAPFAIL